MYPRIPWELVADPLGSAEHFGNHCYRVAASLVIIRRCQAKVLPYLKDDVGISHTPSNSSLCKKRKVCYVHQASVITQSTNYVQFLK
jgi:hypothetical protein